MLRSSMSPLSAGRLVSAAHHCCMYLSHGSGPAPITPACRAPWVPDTGKRPYRGMLDRPPLPSILGTRNSIAILHRVHSAGLLDGVGLPSSSVTCVRWLRAVQPSVRVVLEGAVRSNYKLGSDATRANVLEGGKQMPFPNTWNTLQDNLAIGTTIPNWTVASELLGDSFSITAVAPTYIELDTPRAQNLQRVPITDFQIVYDLWNGYCQGAVLRHEIRDLTRFSKYIISLLHWLESQSGGQLP